MTTQPSPTDITRALREIESTELHPTRQLARKLVAEHRHTIDPDYDFSEQPRELRQVFYDATVRFSRRRWWARWLR